MLLHHVFVVRARTLRSVNRGTLLDRRLTNHELWFVATTAALCHYTCPSPLLRATTRSLPLQVRVQYCHCQLPRAEIARTESLYKRSIVTDQTAAAVLAVIYIMNFKAIFWAVVVAAVVAMSSTVEAG